MTSRADRIIQTSTACRFKGAPRSGIPTLVWRDGIDVDASDWFRHLILKAGASESSCLQLAKTLRPFLRFCRMRGRHWKTVDDEFLILWRERLLRGEGVSPKRINDSLTTIFAFYRWAEESRRIHLHVGIYRLADMAEDSRRSEYPISAREVSTKSRRGRISGGWTTPLTLSGGSKSSPVRHTPTEDQIRKLHEVIIEKTHGERDSLMFSWAEETGLRRFEFLQVMTAQVPSQERLAELIEADEPWIIKLQRKGGRQHSISVLPDLLVRTADYIQFGRQSIVSRIRDRVVGYRDPGHVFLSSTTGLVLHPDSVTSIGGKAFRKAGITRANVHRLRARFAVRVIDTLVEALAEANVVFGTESTWCETLLVKASEVMGHSDPRSLRPYLTYVLNRRITNAEVSKQAATAARLRQMLAHEATIARRLQTLSGFESVANLLIAGHQSEALAEIEKLSATISLSIKH